MSTASNSTRTKTNSTGTGSTVATGWHRFKMVVNAAATNIESYVDGNDIGGVASNIPTSTASGRGTEAAFTIIKSAGTTAATTNIDYFQYRKTLTTQR